MSGSVSVTSLSDIPRELLAEIFAALTQSEIFWSVRLVSREWREISLDPLVYGAPELPKPENWTHNEYFVLKDRHVRSTLLNLTHIRRLQLLRCINVSHDSLFFGCQRVDRLEQLILDITSRAMAIDLGKLSIPTLRSLELNRSSTGIVEFLTLCPTAFPNLQRLTIRGLSPHDFPPLHTHSWKRFATLRYLEFDRSTINPEIARKASLPISFGIIPIAIPSLEELVLRSCRGSLDRARLWNEVQTKEQPLSLFSDACTSLRTLTLMNVTAAIPLFAFLPELNVGKLVFHHESVEHLGYSGTIANMMLDVDFRALVNSPSIETLEIDTDPRRIPSLENLRSLTHLIIPREYARTEQALAVFSKHKPHVKVTVVQRQRPLNTKYSLGAAAEERSIPDAIGIVEVAPDRKEIVCPDCNWETLSLEDHADVCVNRIRRCPCSALGCTFSTRELVALHRHMESQCNSWRVSCAFCPRELPRHLYQSHEDSHNEVCCKVDTILACPCSALYFCDFEGSGSEVAHHLRLAHPVFAFRRDFPSSEEFETALAEGTVPMTDAFPQQWDRQVWGTVLDSYRQLFHSSEQHALRDPRALTDAEVAAERDRMLLTLASARDRRH